MLRLPSLVLLLAIPLGARAQDLTKVEIKTTHVAKNVHLLEGAGGNIGVSAGKDGVLIVDDQFADLAPKIKAALAKLGKDKPRYILNTHWHGDHTGGNAVFGKEGTSIIAHDNVRKRLARGASVRGRQIPPAAPEALPVITFDHSLSVFFNGEEIRAIHLPEGHTDGDVAVWFTDANVIHAGDQFFNGRFPYIDLDSGGTVEGYIENVKTLLAKAPPGAKIIPGHGPLATAADLEKFRDMLLETSGIVREKIAAKKSLDQIKKEGLPAKWASWSGEFIDTGRWLEILHRGLSAAGK